MNTKRLKIGLTAVLVFLFTASSNAQKIDISNVTAINVNIACQLILVQGNSPNIEILGNDKAVDNVKTQIRNGKLTLTHQREARRVRKDDIVVKIEVSDLKRLDIGGAVDMKTVRELVFDDFTLNVSGVGNVEMQLIANSFRLNCSGVGRVDIAGEANDVRMVVSGVGNVRATNFKAKNARVIHSGVGSVLLHAEENLNASVSGIGSISYAGSPSVSTNVSGMGRIRRL